MYDTRVKRNKFKIKRLNKLIENARGEGHQRSEPCKIQRNKINDR